MIGLHAVPRPLVPGDEARLERMLQRLSPQTRQRRFFSPMPRVPRRLVDALSAVDHDRHEALVVQIGDEIIALGSYHRSASDPTVADIAVVVEDDWQHHGIGRRLVRALSRLAASRGIVAFHADVLPDNRQAVGLVHRMSRDTARARFEDGTLAYDLPLVSAAA